MSNTFYPGPTSWYPSYITQPYANSPSVIPQLSPADLISLQLECERTAIHTNAQLVLKAADRDNKMMIEQFKKQKELELMAAREAYRIRRETMTSSVILDSDGRLRRELHMGNEDIKLSSPLCKISSPKIVKFFSVEAGTSAFVLSINADGLKHPVLMYSEKLTAALLKSKLLRQGITIRAPRREMTGVIEEILGLFVFMGAETELAYTSGWSVTTAGHIYSHDFRETFCGKKEEALNE